jgi:nucleoporin SEH1
MVMHMYGVLRSTQQYVRQPCRSSFSAELMRRAEQRKKNQTQKIQSTMTSTTMMPSTDTSTSTSTQLLDSKHLDYIHHVSFDIYGRRMATCSGDRVVKVWDLQADGSWQLASDWPAHRSGVEYLGWSHPEFGTLIATAGSDHDVKIWEERLEGYRKVWSPRALLSEARRSVHCCEFAPRHFGLQLATGSADGWVRIYEAVDILNLSQWPLQGSIQAFGEPGVTCLSWCTGRFEAPTLVVGGSHLTIYTYVSASRQWLPLMSMPSQGPVTSVAWAPNVGRRFHWIAATESQTLHVYQLARLKELELEASHALDEGVPMWKCQWNVTGTVLASSGDAGVVQLWKADQQQQWKCVSQIHGDLTAAEKTTG